ncbi:hypothetical protein BKA69DRAFT_1040201 [Paraphysoderma sedebokerense]|nr:hypothetical protein BKA69DRAFT_1040201 [Paraphysoderma sedebokerense]
MTDGLASKIIFDYPDILDTLFRYLTNSDIKNLSLTNSCFKYLAKPTLFARCSPTVENLHEFAASSVAQYVRKLEIQQIENYLFDTNDNTFWHNMPRLDDLVVHSGLSSTNMMGEVRVSYDMLAKLGLFTARVQIVELPKVLPDTLEHLELSQCETVKNSEVLSTFKHSLTLYETNLQSLRTLHSSLTHLEIVNYGGIELSNLPPSLISLTWKSDRKDFPKMLPAVLQYLDCACSDLISLPHLPGGLKYLDCSFNHLLSIGNVPSTLELLICDGNNLEFLPVLPPSLKMLSCSANPLENYFSSPNSGRLPSSLKFLKVSGSCKNGFSDTLPSGLVFFDCSCNELTSLPLLPQSLEQLICNDNKLQSLPPLPASLRFLFCTHNKLKCWPTLPPRLKFLNADPDSGLLLPELFFSKQIVIFPQWHWQNTEEWKYIYKTL